MFFLREPIVKATIRLLQLYGVWVNESTVNETLQNHPAWPSLLSVSDALSEWKVPNAAGKSKPEDLDTIPTPFLAAIKGGKSQQAVVSQIRDNEVDIYKNEFDRIEIMAGYSCGWRSLSGSVTQCGVSQAYAMNLASGGNGYWCCSSCASNGGSASYC